MNTNLPIFAVGGNIENFLTTKRDLKAGICKNPGQEYRVKDEDEYIPIDFKNLNNTSYYSNNLDLSDEEGIQFEELNYMSQKFGSHVDLLQDFEILAIIGKGSFGKIYAAREKKSDRLCAIKSISKELLLDKDCIESTMLEKDILIKNEHPYLINMSQVIQTEMKIYFVMRLARGGDLYQMLQ